MQNLIQRPYKAKINLLVYASIAKPNPKMGQALGPLGINMMQFCKDFNAQTVNIKPDSPMRVVLKAYPDRTYEFKIKPPPTSWFIKRCIGKTKCTNFTGHVFIDRIAVKACYEIALIKKNFDPDFKNTDIETITSQVVAQCASMGVNVVLDRDMPNLVQPKLKI